MVYNLTQEPGRAAVLIISQVGEHRVQVTVTLTSTEMREPPLPEQSDSECSQGLYGVCCVCGH